MNIVATLLAIVLEIIKAAERNDDKSDAEIDDALMRAEEAIKREMDRRKFGKRG